MSKENKNYPATIAGLWRTRGGKQLRSMPVDERMFDTVQKVLAGLAMGGKLVVREVNAETRKAKGDKFPEAFLEYISPEQLEAERAAAQARSNDGI
jgi:hypothetical protein